MKMSMEMMKALHSEVGGGACGYDSDPWPCDMTVVLDALSAAQAEAERLREANQERANLLVFSRAEIGRLRARTEHILQCLVEFQQYIAEQQPEQPATSGEG